MNLGKNKYRIRTYSALAVVFLIIFYLIDLAIFDELAVYRSFIHKLSITIVIISSILLIGQIIEKVIITQTEAQGVRYNLLRITQLITGIFTIIVIASFLFQNLYAAAVSFGLISLILGFALQSPITSFIAWLYIVFRRPYQVGHRIQIDGFKGDVIEISYLDTIIEEFNGNYLENDRKSGRLIHFPNSQVLKSQVINYSGQFKPFIWNETAIQISYTSDLQFVESCLIEATQRDFTDTYKDKLINFNESAVYYRVNSFAWLEAVVSYPVEPEDTTGRRNRILRLALPLLNAQPDKVGFPEGSKR
ncbi:MAG TPA: mechanosensitive ion channel [Candidatus Kapabacteria bacterium]|nr:mechanosensitive ion channel [Candidatus Kapabacteria bacterium]